MSLTSYRAAPPRGSVGYPPTEPRLEVHRGGELKLEEGFVLSFDRSEGTSHLLGRPGSDRLSRVLGRSTIGAEGFHGRVRNGIGCFAPRYSHQVVQANSRRDAKRIPSVCLMRTRGAHTQAQAGLGDARGGKGRFQADRVIRIGKLNALPRFHIRPINVVVYHDSSGRPRLKVGFPLRCIQRLSRPHIATRRCRWRDNRYTRGASIPVLSY
jgi:hypothetical protein